MKLFINTGEANSIQIRLPLKFVSLYGCLRAYYATLALLMFCLVVNRKGKDPPELYIFTITSHVLANAKKPWPGCHEINDIVSLFLAHQYYTVIKWLKYCRCKIKHYLINQLITEESLASRVS